MVRGWEMWKGKDKADQPCKTNSRLQFVDRLKRIFGHEDAPRLLGNSVNRLSHLPHGLCLGRSDFRIFGVRGDNTESRILEAGRTFEVRRRGLTIADFIELIIGDALSDLLRP